MEIGNSAHGMRFVHGLSTAVNLLCAAVLLIDINLIDCYPHSLL